MRKSDPPSGSAPRVEADTRRAGARSAAGDRLWDWFWWSSVAQGLLLGTLCLGACSGIGVPSLAAVAVFFWLAAVAAAGMIGFVVFRSWRGLRWGWIASSCLTWLVLAAETAVLAAFLRP